MKEGWEEKNLKDLIEIKHGYAFKSEDFKTEYIGKNPIVLTPGNFSEDSKIIFNEKNTKRCHGNFPDEYRFNIGDLVIVMTDLSSKMKILGKPAIIDTQNILHNQRIGRVLFKSDTLDWKFLYYFFQSENYIKEIRNSATGTMVKHTAPKRILSNKIFYPKSLEKQKEIVAILDEAFAAIDTAQANIEKNIANANELFQSRLNEIFSRKGEGWEEKRLGDVCDLYQGLAINVKTKYLLVEKSNLPLLRIKDLKNHTEEQYVLEEGFPENSRVYKEDIIYTRTGSLGLVFRGREGVLHNNSFKVVPKGNISKDYLYWWLQHEKFTSDIVALASRAAQPDITHKLFKAQKITIPPLKDQDKFYIKIEELNKLKGNVNFQYQQKLSNLEELKKSLLHKAFAGELT